MSCRRPGGTSHENNRFVVPGVTVTAEGSFDPGVVRLDFSGGGAGDDEDFNRIPPPAHSAVELFVSGRPAASTRSLRLSFAAAASIRELVRSRMRNCSLTFYTACSLPVASSALSTSSKRWAALSVSVAPGRRSSLRCAQALSTPRPRRPFVNANRK